MSDQTAMELETEETIHSFMLEPNFAEEIKAHPGGEKLSLCYQCGVCAGSCPVGKLTGSYKPRQILRMALLGLKKEVLSSDSIWLCALCYTCQERCSQGVEIADIMLVLRNLAVREGYVSKPVLDQAKTLMEHGRLATIAGSTERLRSKLGLPSLSTSANEVVKTIVRLTGFDALVETLGG